MIQKIKLLNCITPWACKHEIKITDFMAINAEGREIQITPELAKKLHPVSDSALIAAIHAGMINPGYIPWCEEKAGIKINLKPIKNEEKKRQFLWKTD